MYKFSNRSLGKLEGVHPDLVKVCKRAIEISSYDFGITDGVRDLETQRKYVSEGKSQTIDSKHLVQDDGYGHAIDFAVYVDGKVTWEIGYYRKVVQAFFTAAIELGVQIEAGAMWLTLADGPHIQLNGNYY